MESLVKLVKKRVEVEKDGEIKNYTNFFLITESGNYIPIKPAFNNDYKVLVVLAEDVTNK